MRFRSLLLFALGFGPLAQAQTVTPPPAPPSPAASFQLILPTDNHSLLEGSPENFFQFVDRSIDGKQVPVWEGGQFGFVRNPLTLTSGATIYTRFHEGLDIKPVHRDAKDEPQDEVRSMAAGEVVYTSIKPGASNYGRYIVVRHDWPDGPFVSLYAHLREITCTVGQKVEPGTPLGIMGYSGVGIDRRRAHTHVELGMYLSSRFPVWHDNHTTSLNYHGMWNGLNLIGFDLSKFLLERVSNPALSASEFIKKTPAHFRIAVPGDAEMELLQHYSWLCSAPPQDKPKSWLISFSAWGLPVKVEASDTVVDGLQVVWVQPSTTVPQFSLTRGLLNGIAGRTNLTNDGVTFVQLATGMFETSAKGALALEGNELPKPKSAPKSKPKAKKKS